MRPLRLKSQAKEQVAYTTDFDGSKTLVDPVDALKKMISFSPKIQSTQFNKS